MKFITKTESLTSQAMKFGRTRKHLQIIGIYILSIAFLAVYSILDKSERIKDFITLTEKISPNMAFLFIILTGVTKYTLLTAGLAVPVILFIFIIVNRKANTRIAQDSTHETNE